MSQGPRRERPRRRKHQKGRTMAHYFTADTHFGDDNVRQFFGRPFRSGVFILLTMIEPADTGQETRWYS